ncbi:D-(-)-3-hydroxybutyrate oligomer hydrolase [Paraburkholderia edwinii]|nr:D-(-)-3-hydroxybutyrate oligomer hydrolase [Paraburkholderia edwinii]
MPATMSLRFASIACCSAAFVCGCGNGGGDGGSGSTINVLPAFVVTSSMTTVSYDGNTDDLLTAGLGKTGLAGDAPGFSNPAAPTAAELRRLAIWSNYRALVDITANGGYGRFWGPNIDLNGNDTLGEGKIAGTETIAYADNGSGLQNVTLMIQVPVSFDPANPCIVTATSSGSRGVYGAISAAGEWGLKRGCAVAYTDKGTGNGAQELMTNLVTLIDGRLASTSIAGTKSTFTANLPLSSLAIFNQTFPNRYAYKHAHSQQNPEQDWGKNTLQAIQFAYWVLNQQFAPIVNGRNHGVRYRAGSITTIAASVSNGGGASLAAAEQDTQGWITAVVVGEPQINLNMSPNAQVFEGGVRITAAGAPLADYITYANLLQPCAAAAPSVIGAPYLSTLPPATTLAIRTARCASLAGSGFVNSGDLATQSNDALNRLHSAGYETDSDLLQAAMWDSQAVPAVAVTYVNAYTTSSVGDNLCGFSFGTTNAQGAAGVPSLAAPMLSIFGLGNGVPPTNNINLVYNLPPFGFDHRLATADASLSGAVCLRGLWTGGDPRMQTSVNAIRVNANLRGKPAIIVQGRSDTLVPVNHASRPYLAMNSLAEGGRSQLSFYEITNAQHFDAFLSVAGFDTRYLPLQYYNLQALNLMWSHLKSGAALPPSQVVRTVPRGGTPGSAPALGTANLTPIAASPGSNAIRVGFGTINVPR